MKRIIIISFGLILFYTVCGQQSEDLSISGNFVDTPFEEFLHEVEVKTPLSFFYRQAWVENIKINFSGNNFNVIQMLKSQIIPLGLNLYIEDNHIYIYPGSEIITNLPSYITSDINHINDNTDDGISKTEEKYLEGKVVSDLEVLSIGDKTKSPVNSRCIIDGRVVDEEDLEPLVGATVYVDEINNGSVTDIDGRFKLVLNPGKYKIVINYMSMKKQEYYFQVYSDGAVEIKMKKELLSLGEVTVTGNHQDNVRGIQMGFEKISAKTIKDIPIVFGEKDILKVAQLLPGVSTVGEGTSGFNVRGSSEDQNMFYINKIPIYNTSHLFGFFTSFNPDIINDFTLYKSNIPAYFGGRLSSVFDITTRQGNKNELFGQGGISPVTAHSAFEIPLVKDKVSLVTSFRTSYSDWILKKIKNENIKQSSASFYDGSFAINADINENNKLKSLFYFSNDKFALASINDFDYSNTGASISWKHSYSSVVSSDIAIIYSSYSYANADKTNRSTAYRQQYRIDHYESRADFSILSKQNQSIKFGASAILYNLDRGNIEPFNDQSFTAPVNFGKEHGVESALYISDEFKLTSNFNVLAGLRYSLFSQFGPATINLYSPEDYKTTENLEETREYKKGDVIKTYSGPEYRVALNYIFRNNSSIKASYNRLYQYIFMLRNSISVSPNDQWKLCDFNIKPPVADQISLGYYKNFKDGGIKASMEIYHKWIENQVEFKDGTDFTSPNPIETQILQGKQRVYGFEFMINKDIGKTTGWVSYSYSRSLIKIDDALRENQINHGIEYPSNYDKPHSFNLVMNHKFNRRLSYSASFVYSTGRPITLPVSIFYAENQELLNFSKRNEYRLPDYARLDLSLILEGNLNKKKPIHSYWSINLYNALGRKNAHSIYFNTENGEIYGHKMSIFGVPLLTISWNYKFGNFLSD